MWQLERPQPALPSSYFWTWDHSTNWVLDDPGNVTFGCYNTYLKQPATYAEDYRRLTDLAAGLGVKGILIWGFLRDAHGGVDSAKQVADYAASKGVAIMPGVGTTDYGGVYYEGNHPYAIETFLRIHPDAAMIDEEGNPMQGSACPSHPAFCDWLSKGLQWLFDEFAIGGINLENGDFMVCHCPQCRAHKASWPDTDPEFFRLQAMSYLPALETVAPYLDDKLVTWATYTGFVPDVADNFRVNTHMKGSMYCPRPALVDRVPSRAITQWTLTGMVRSKWEEDAGKRPLPLLSFLDNGVPDEAFEYEGWPRELRPVGPRSVGFLHQGSQWSGDRNELVVSTIKEGCLRAYRAGLEGVSIHGEMTARHVPWALNYLAFSHFIHWPEDSLRDFGRKTLGQVLGNVDDGEAFVEALALVESGKHSEALTEELRKRAADAGVPFKLGQEQNAYMHDRWRCWNWLWMSAAVGSKEWMRVSNFL